MAVRQIEHSPGGRVDVGDAVLAAAKTVNLGPVKKRHAAFAAAHKGYCAAHAAVGKLTAALHAGEGAVTEADIDQDAAVEALANALVADGLPRQNPFKPFGLTTPSQVEKLEMTTEAHAVHKLVAAVRKRKDLSKATLAAAADLEAKAIAVEKRAAQLPNLQRAQAVGMASRDALGRPWAAAFARLKRAAQSADDDGAEGLFAQLFEVDAKPRRKAEKKSSPAKSKPQGPSKG